MSNNSATPEELERDIARQREELAGTVTELHRRLDVKTRAEQKVTELRQQPAVLAAVALGGVALLGLLVWRVRARRG